MNTEKRHNSILPDLGHKGKSLSTIDSTKLSGRFPIKM